MSSFKKIPLLTAKCSRSLTFNDLVFASETLELFPEIDNQPKELATYDALSELARNLVDPITEKFGPIKITYGFAGAELTRRIPGRISPKHGQHASCEKNRSGHYICPRKGAAIDFKIENKSSLVIAKWVIMHTPFDRLYFYGPERPIHLSFGPDHSRQVVTFRPTRLPGQFMPNRVSLEKFLSS